LLQYLLVDLVDQLLLELLGLPAVLEDPLLLFDQLLPYLLVGLVDLSLPSDQLRLFDLEDLVVQLRLSDQLLLYFLEDLVDPLLLYNLMN
jgi:hypothetical protein